MGDYVCLYEVDTKSEKRKNEEVMDYIIVMMNKVNSSTISSVDFKDEIIEYCRQFNHSRYHFLKDVDMLNELYSSYNFKSNVTKIINLYVNNFIKFDDLRAGFKVGKNINKEKHNFNKLISYCSNTAEAIQNSLLSDGDHIKVLAAYGFLVDSKKDVIYINNLINAHNSGILTLSDKRSHELLSYERFSKITIV